jgi:PrtD family type I secretion system ABC transporter
MIASSILLGRGLAPVEQAIGAWKQFVGARSAHERLRKLLGDYEPRSEAIELPPPRGEYRVENVVAVAPGGNLPILKGISLHIPAGTVLGVIGPSGSGKSTLARLLVGVWGTAAGVVRLDGADVHAWDKAELGPWLGYLPQDVELFDGTVAENIARFGEVDSAAVVRAASQAGVHELVLRLPEGYETSIGTGGCALSGGQRQRIALARALYGNPSALVLDEPNSNLDDVGETALIEAVKALKAAGKTVVLITHRTSVLSVVDALVVLRDGKVHAYGAPSEVMAALRQPAGPGAPASPVPAAPSATPGSPVRLVTSSS